MADRNTLYQLLFDALLEFRFNASETNNTPMFELANMLHHLPLQLKDLDAGRVTADQIIVELRERAEAAGLATWLDRRTAASSIASPQAEVA